MIDTKEYAKALFMLSEEELCTDAILDSLCGIKEIICKNPEYIKLLDTPAITNTEKMHLIDSAFPEVETIMINFLKILTEKHSVYLFAKCADEFNRLYAISRGIDTAVAITTQPLTDNQTASLKAKLEKITNKTIRIKNEIDPSLIGGIALRISGKQYDGSIKARLEDFQRSLGKIIV